MFVGPWLFSLPVFYVSPLDIKDSSFVNPSSPCFLAPSERDSFAPLSNGRCLLIEWISFLNESVDKNDSVIHSLTQSNALFLNESAVWMNRLNLNDSLINSHLLSPTGGFNFTFRLFFSCLNISNISIQRFMLKTKQAYLCICNCSLNASMSPLWYIKLCKYI